MSPEPDAYMKPTVGERLGPDFSEHKNHRNWRGYEDEVQPLFSAETIQEEAEKVIQEIKNSKGVSEKEEAAMAQAIAMLGTSFTKNQALKAEKDSKDNTQ